MITIRLNTDSEAKEFWENLNEVFDILFSLKRMWLYSFNERSKIDAIEVSNVVGQKIRSICSAIDGFDESPLIFEGGDE